MKHKLEDFFYKLFSAENADKWAMAIAITGTAYFIIRSIISLITKP